MSFVVVRWEDGHGRPLPGHVYGNRTAAMMAAQSEAAALGDRRWYPTPTQIYFTILRADSLHHSVSLH